MLDKRVRHNHAYAYTWYRKTYHTRTCMVCTVRVRYEIRVRYPTKPPKYQKEENEATQISKRRKSGLATPD